MMISAPTLRLVVLLFCPVLLLGTSVWLYAPPQGGEGAPTRYARQPPLGHTGGFGEPTCTACHFGSRVNEGGGRLTVEGVSDSVTPGRTYRVRLVLADTMQRAGFMMSVRRFDGSQAGRLAPVDSARVAVRSEASAEVQYAHHTWDGTELATPNRATWTVRWTAPEAGGDSVVVHAAANATNDDASAFGDDVYSTAARVLVTQEE